LTGKREWGSGQKIVWDNTVRTAVFLVALLSNCTDPSEGTGFEWGEKIDSC